MQRNNVKYGNLSYLQNKPKIINWEVVAGGELHPLQMYDVVYDKIDMKIRGLIQK